MTDAPITFLVPEPVWVTLLVVWGVALGLAWVAGYFLGVASERKRKGL